MRSLVSHVEVEEDVSVRAGHALTGMGYVLADSGGYALDRLDARVSLGILWQDPRRPPERFLFGLITVKQPRVFIGFLKFGDAAWDFTVYGRRNLEEATSIANRLSAESGTLIRIRLWSEEEKYEQTRSGDYDGDTGW